MQLPLETRRTKQAKRENKNRRNNKENKETREKQNKEQNKTRAGGAGGPEAEQLHAYTCDGQCNCAHASKSTQTFTDQKINYTKPHVYATLRHLLNRSR